MTMHEYSFVSKNRLFYEVRGRINKMSGSFWYRLISLFISRCDAPFICISLFNFKEVDRCLLTVDGRFTFICLQTPDSELLTLNSHLPTTAHLLPTAIAGFSSYPNFEYLLYHSGQQHIFHTL